MWQSVKYTLLFFIIFLSIINFKSSLFAEKIFITPNNSLIIDISKDIDSKLKNYIFSSIPFKADIKIILKKYSGFFFIKDKKLKLYENSYRFNYDIIKKRFTIKYNKNTFTTTDYAKFLKKLAVLNFKNFLSVANYKNIYIEISIAFTPIKGDFSLSNIYILNKVKAYNLFKKIDLEDLIFGRKR